MWACLANFIIQRWMGEMAHPTLDEKIAITFLFNLLHSIKRSPFIALDIFHILHQESGTFVSSPDRCNNSVQILYPHQIGDTGSVPDWRT